MAQTTIMQTESTTLRYATWLDRGIAQVIDIAIIAVIGAIIAVPFGSVSRNYLWSKEASTGNVLIVMSRNILPRFSYIYNPKAGVVETYANWN